MTPERAEYRDATALDALTSSVESLALADRTLLALIEGLREDVNALANRLEANYHALSADIRETREAFPESFA